MDFKTTPLDTSVEDSFYDIIMKGAGIFSSGKLKEVERVSISSATAFRPEDPQEIDLYASFARGKPKYLSATLEYDKNRPIANQILNGLLANIPSKNYKITARQNLTEQSIEQPLSKEPAHIRIEAPFGWGFTDVSLPKEANWIDTSLLCGVLDSLGLRYKQDGYLSVKSLKLSGTSMNNLISAYDFFVKNNFETKLELELMPITAILKNCKEKQMLKYSFYSIFGVKKNFADEVQKMFEKHLSFTGQGRPYMLNERSQNSEPKE